MNVEKKFFKTQSEYSLINPNDTIIVGFSGGSDSVVLTHLLIKLKNHLKYKEIILVHVNHMLRGEDSFKDEQFCIEFAKKYNLKIEVFREDIKKLAEKEKKSIEEIARKVRYEKFKEVKEKYKADKIATGHHLSDLAETMIMWFLQGNKKGLKGFKPKERDIIRPLYYITKEEIEKYAKEHGLSYRIDVSNFSTDFLRNKVRLEVLPVLKTINPSLESSLLILSKFLHIDDEFLEKLAEEHFEKVKDQNFINLSEIKEKAILYRIIQRWVYHKTGKYLSYTALLEVLSIVEKGGTKEIHIDNENLLIKEYNKLYLSKRKSTPSFEYRLKIGDEVFIKEANIVVKSYLAQDINMDKLKNEHIFVCFDIPDLKVDEEFIIRNRKAGDRFIPYGKNSEKKLKDVMMKLKIPKYMRQSIPLLVFRNKILWIIGHKRSALYPVKESSNKLVCFEVKEVR